MRIALRKMGSPSLLMNRQWLIIIAVSQIQREEEEGEDLWMATFRMKRLRRKVRQVAVAGVW